MKLMKINKNSKCRLSFITPHLYKMRKINPQFERRVGPFITPHDLFESTQKILIKLATAYLHHNS
jgi:hypothetical protein